jgi:hypothetical protein
MCSSEAETEVELLGGNSIGNCHATEALPARRAAALGWLNRALEAFAPTVAAAHRRIAAEAFHRRDFVLIVDRFGADGAPRQIAGGAGLEWLSHGPNQSAQWT